MAIQMIGGQIKNRRRPGPKGMDGLQLETADLGDKDFIFSGTVDIVSNRVANISDHIGSPAGGFEDLAQQGSGGGFSIGSGNRNKRCSCQSIGRFNLSSDRNTLFIGGLNNRDN